MNNKDVTEEDMLIAIKSAEQIEEFIKCKVKQSE